MGLRQTGISKTWSKKKQKYIYTTQTQLLLVIGFISLVQVWWSLTRVVPGQRKEGRYHGTVSSIEDDKGRWNRSEYSIPPYLHFTHYKNLLDETKQLEFNEEEKALADNIRHTIQVHDDIAPMKTFFFTDKECIESLERVCPSLVPFFLNETEGMFKADMCRGAALYEHGGFYLDVDVGVRHSLWKDLRSNTEFVTARVHRQSKFPGHFFQAILGSSPQNPVMMRYLRLFEKHYTGIERIKQGPLGVILLKRAWEQVSKSTRTMLSKTELYQEVLYSPTLFPHLQPAPIWGTRRACHFVVVASVNHKENTEEEIPTNDGNRTMCLRFPVLSRVPGSRMCPDEVQGQKQRTNWWERD